MFDLTPVAADVLQIGRENSKYKYRERGADMDRAANIGLEEISRRAVMGGVFSVFAAGFAITATATDAPVYFAPASRIGFMRLP